MPGPRDRKTEGRSVEADARAMLERRGRPDLRRLFTLIHDVNPTGRELPPAVERERYALKSQLQSMLVRHFRDDLGVALDPERPGFIVLRHPQLGLVACHAALDSLDDHAGSWVRFQLDVGAGQPSPSAPTVTRNGTAQRTPSDRRSLDSANETHGELVQRGRDALEAYDYDTARACFEDALARTGGEATAALPLLELLVDLLAADDDALALEAQLSPSCHGVPEIRALVALAAARVGQRSRAATLLDGVAGARVADVLAALTESALRDGTANEAFRWLTALVEREPGHRDRSRYEGAVGELRARDRAPAEQALAHAIEAGDLDAAESRAKEVLTHWPESEVARRALRRVREGQRQREIVALVAEADRALAAGAPDTAASAIERVRVLGPVEARLESALADAMAEQTSRDDARRVAQTVDVLNAKDMAPGLRTYLALPPALRARVRAVANIELLDWCERMEASGMRSSARDVIAAAKAFEQAISLVSRGDHADALALLTEHEAVLKSLDAAKELMVTCRQTILAQRRARAVAEIQAANQAFTMQRNDLVRRHMGAIDRSCLSPAELDQVAGLDAAMARWSRLLEAVDRFKTRIQEGDLTGARNVATKVIECGDAHEGSEWLQRRDELTVCIRTAWHVCEIEGTAEIEELGDVSTSLDVTWASECSLLPGGRELMLATVFGPWLILRCLDRSTGKVVRRRLFLMPGDYSLWGLCVEANGLWVYFFNALLQLAKDTWDVLNWWNLEHLVAAGEKSEGLLLAPGGRYVWALAEHAELGSVARVYDLERERVSRELVAISSPHPIHGSDDAQVLSAGYSEDGRLTTSRGTTSAVPWRSGHSLLGAAPHPVTGKFIVLTSPPDATAPGGRNVIIVCVMGADGQWGLSATIPDINPIGANVFASARSTGVAVAALHRDEVGTTFVVMTPHDEEISVARRMTFGAPVTLAQDAAGEHLVAVYPTQTGVGTLTLDANIDDLPGIRPSARGSLKAFTPPFFCGPYLGSKLAIEFCERFRRTPAGEHASLARVLCELNRDDPARLIALAVGWKDSGHPEMARTVAEFAHAHHPAVPSMVMLRAHFAAEQREWQVVRDVLEGLADDALKPPESVHRDHLLGLAFLYTDDPKKAMKVMTRSLVERTRCGIEHCVDLAVVAIDTETDPDAPDSKPLVHFHAARMLLAIRRADAALARGDMEGVIALLHRPPVLGGGERQSLARLAVAHLAVTPRDGASWLQKVLALAEFGSVHPLMKFLGLDLPVPHAHWDDTRLSVIASEAHAWLDRETASVAAGGPLSAARPLQSTS